MLAALLTRLNPYTLYIKIALIAVVLASCAIGGYKVSDWKWSAKYNKEAAERQAAIAKQFEIARAKDLAQAQRDREVVKTYEAKLTAARTELSALRARIEGEADAQFTSDNKERPFTLRFVRDFNSLSNSTADSSGVPDAAKDSAGAVDPDAAIADLTRKDLLAHHADQMSQCRVWKQQLDAIIQWDRETFEKGK